MPTLVFLHGGPGFQDYLRPFFSDLEDTFRCVFYDQVSGPEVQLEEMLSQLDGVVNAISGEKILVGHSWGGILALEYAVRKQSDLAGLVLISTGLTHEHWRKEFHKELNDLGLAAAPPEQIFLAPNELEEGKPLLESTSATFSAETFESLNATYLNQFDLRDAVAELRIPILNIFGERDVRFPPRITKSFRRFNSAIIDFEIPDTGHFPFLQARARTQIRQILEEFFLKPCGQ